jgi:hypothetical protein|tara:strand:- start:35 stop:406 length:372 start_codon:yes stop_codon:yes gene_type:complete
MEITLTFDARTKLNTSLQVGDTVWYVSTNSAGGYNVAPKSSVNKLGKVEELSFELSQAQIKVSRYDTRALPMRLNTFFFMFSKDSRANVSSLVGYYAKATFTNNSKEKIELFAVNSEIVASSK